MAADVEDGFRSGGGFFGAGGEAEECECEEQAREAEGGDLVMGHRRGVEGFNADAVRSTPGTQVEGGGVDGDFHEVQLEGSKKGGEGDVGGVAAVGDDDAVALGDGLHGVEGIPAVADVGFEPGVEVHGLEFMEETDDHAGGDIERAAEGDAEVGVVAADALEISGGVDGGGGGVTGAGGVGDGAVDPVVDFGDVVVGERGLSDDGVGQGGEDVGLAVAAGKKVVQEIGREVLDGHDGGVEIHFDLVLDLDAELDIDLEIARGHDDALAGVAVDVGEFDDGDLRMDVELFPHDPLGPTAARAEHEDGGDLLEVVVFDPAGGV